MASIKNEERMIMKVSFDLLSSMIQFIEDYCTYFSFKSHSLNLNGDKHNLNVDNKYWWQSLQVFSLIKLTIETLMFNLLMTSNHFGSSSFLVSICLKSSLLLTLAVSTSFDCNISMILLPIVKSR